jgi:phospholipid transport system substrate-binding protein
MMKKLIHVGLFAALLSAATVWADVPPDVMTRNTAQEVLNIIKHDKSIQAGNKRKVVALVDAKVLPHFNFEHMTQMAMGRNWAKASPAQKAELVKQFRALLVRTYSGSLTAYRNQTIEFKPLVMHPGETDVTVKSVVHQPGGQPIPIDYNLEKTPAGWKVYDITVDGVSLVLNYRTSFNNEISHGGINALIRTLARKNAAELGGK